MSFSNLLRRTLVHYISCSPFLTLLTPELASASPRWIRDFPIYYEDFFLPGSTQDPSITGFPVVLDREEDGDFRLINAHTGNPHPGKGLAFYCIPRNCSRALLMEQRCNGDTVTVVVPEDIWEMVQPLTNNECRFEALITYCLISDTAQDVTKKFLTDPASATTLFHCLCYLASHLEGTCAGLEDLDVRRLTDTFNHRFSHLPGMGTADPEAVLELIRLMELGDVSDADLLYGFMTSCAVRDHCSR